MSRRVEVAEQKNEAARFNALRKLVMDAIEEVADCGGKSYEGTFEWTVCYPDYWQDPEAKQGPDCYVLTLHCYLIGPARHYYWRGKTKAEVLDKAEREIKSWLN